MGKTRGLYQEEFPVGSEVRIVGRPELERFQREWKWHNRLTTEQLDYADQTVRVKSVSFYHGGDELYTLEGVPGIWHETCLKLP